MTKTNEELQKLKAEYETLTTKLQELTEDEYKQVVGGTRGIDCGTGSMVHTPKFGATVIEEEISPTSTKCWFGITNPKISQGGQHQR